jgi:thiol-disulfide isomerase/thioredoxin
MKKHFCVLIVLCSFLSAFGQKEHLITLDQLNKRISEGKDTLYVINFWATWCIPCVKELAHFEKLQADFVKKKVKVLLVSVDFKSKLQSSVLPFIKKHQLKNEVFLLDEPDQQVYIDRVDPSWSGTIPATLFINKDKRVFLEQEFTYGQLVNQIQKIQ